jgi:hypothetical protein
MTAGHKALKGVEIKDEGRVRAVFATFNVKDLDGDVTLPGAFEEGAPVRISAFGHASWGMSRGASSVPVPLVGKGVIRTTATDAILDGKFFLTTTAGRDHYELVKEMGDQQEWSYGYDTLKAEPGQFKGEPVQFLHQQRVHEVSPVLLGAGIGTRTLEVKERDGGPDGEGDPPEGREKSFPDEADGVLAGIHALVTRAEGWGSGSDQKAGRVISTANRERIRAITDGMAEAMQALEGLLAETDPADPNKELFMREFVRFQQLRASL